MTTSLRDAAVAFVGVPARPQTYRNLLYLVLAFPLGLGYFLVLATGFSLGTGLAITVVGVPILLATLAAARLLANVEAELANRLLGVEAASAALDTSDGALAVANRLATEPRTWLGVVYLAGKFAFGVAAFVALTAALSVSASLLAAPLTYSSSYHVGARFGTLSVGPFESGALAVDALPEAVGVALVGAFVALVSLHLLNGLARASGLAAEALLGPSTTK
ncbi:sensor domain-containing protein [Halorussus marinus]|uniref:sensor domain-containing protein n=1 Tax=Halorussus marinus TaxID=2505976 RepID=UPI00106EC723|nr:sensor domain-containing protein [Halorussus marinus]